jgi:hypothetical protein
MMKLTSSILAAAVCGLIGMMAPTLAQAQTVPAETPLPAPLGGPPAATSPASGPPVVRPPAPPKENPFYDCKKHGDCCDGHKVCVPTPDVKVTEKRLYSAKCQDFCLPCSCWDMLFHRCGGCSKVHTRKVLVLKIRKCETPTTRCVPAIEASCDTPCGSCSSCASGLAPCPKCSTPCGSPSSGPMVTTLPAPVPMTGPLPRAIPAPGVMTIPGGPAIQPQPLPPGAQPTINGAPMIQPQPIPPGAQPLNNAAKLPAGH